MGQQFGTDTFLIDIRKLNRVLHLDRQRGILEVESGIEWPELIEGYLALQNGGPPPWGIAQKTNRRGPVDHSCNHCRKRARSRTGDEAVRQQRRVLRSQT